MASRRPLLISPPEAEEVDHIGHLPDAIIHHIFSFLPFKDVVKTSLLSKQWRFAWTSTPYIHLTLPSEGVVPSIGRALRLCTATKVKKFHIDTTMSDSFIPNWWFHFAVARKVEDASMGFGGWCPVATRFMCHCASLVSLQANKCCFPRDTIINWPSLKKLSIHHSWLETNEITKILSGCPVLESLTLRFLHGPWDIPIVSRSLRELVIETGYLSLSEISAPNLLSLRLSGGFVRVHLKLNGVSSLAEAELNFDKPTDFPDRLKVLEQLQHVAKITVGSWCLEVLSASKAMGEPYLLSRWRNIIVYTTFCEREVLGLVYLLQTSRLLERLIIRYPKSNNGSFKNKDFPELFDFDEKQFWSSQKEFYCVANHLKRVEIVGFEFHNGKSKFLLALAKFLLKEAVGLEKMTIDIDLRTWHQGVPTDPHDLLDFHDVIQLQESCWRASRNAEVIVNYHFNGRPYVL